MHYTRATDARYAVKQRDRYEEEGLKMAQMCSDLIGSMKNTKALQAIGAKELVQEMQTVNTECRELVTLRNSERSQQDKGQMQAARDRMVEEYRLTVLILNALALERGHSLLPQGGAAEEGGQ